MVDTKIQMSGLTAALNRGFVSKYLDGSLETEALAASILKVSRGLVHDHAPRSAVVTILADHLYQILGGRLEAHQCLLTANNLVAALQQEGFWGIVTKTHEGMEINCVSCNMDPERAMVQDIKDRVAYTRSPVTRRPADVQGYRESMCGVDIGDVHDVLQGQCVALNKDMLPIVRSVLPVLSDEKRPHVERVLDHAVRVGSASFRSGWFNDWRDRFYADSGGVLSHQNCKFSRAILQTPEPYRVTDEGRKEGMAWIEREYGKPPKIVNHSEVVANDPKSGIMAIAAWNEWRRLAAGAEYSSFIAYPDASCSGLQFMSLFLRDRRIAEATNLVGNAKSDLYTLVADNTELSNPRKNRSWSKPSIQVISYGGGVPKCAAHTANLVPEFAAMSQDEQMYTAECYFNSFFELFPTAKWLIRNTQKRAAMMAARGRHWSFVTPMGTKATAYKLVKDPDNKELVQIGHSRFKSNCSVTPLIPDFGVAGSLANMTHSADAAVCGGVVVAGHKTGRMVLPIHDSFGVTINDIQWVRNEYLNQMRHCYDWAPAWLKANNLDVRDCGLRRDEINNLWALA